MTTTNYRGYRICIEKAGPHYSARISRGTEHSTTLVVNGKGKALKKALAWIDRQEGEK